MCVRYTLHKPEAALASVTRALKDDLAPAEWVRPRYNVSLTSEVPIVMADLDGPLLVKGRWGYPRMGLGEPGGPHANAKSETARELRTFSAAARGRRCLVPANGFYEWQEREGRKWPFLFELRGHESFCFAGLWLHAGEDTVFCFLTTAANPDVAPMHDRMPVLLTAEGFGLWLSDAPLADNDWTTLCATPPAGTLTATALDTYVSSTRHEGPSCHAPLGKHDTQLDLF
ncbi:SOS response-associated peptidase [Nibricoccus sp. IMCC34717]|uniref:SOS response-associated peptidase n=1 Tax=Nibricoccus sp. IMCC34717 TaxID=3034021 RepID=UPI003850B0F1